MRIQRFNESDKYIPSNDEEMGVDFDLLFSSKKYNL